MVVLTFKELYLKNMFKENSINDKVYTAILKLVTANYASFGNFIIEILVKYNYVYNNITYFVDKDTVLEIMELFSVFNTVVAPEYVLECDTEYLEQSINGWADTEFNALFYDDIEDKIYELYSESGYIDYAASITLPIVNIVLTPIVEVIYKVFNSINTCLYSCIVNTYGSNISKILIYPEIRKDHLYLDILPWR